MLAVMSALPEKNSQCAFGDTMSKDFERDLKRIIENLSEGVERQAKNDIYRLLKKNKSFESLQSLLINEEADPEHRVVACWAFGQLRDKQAVKALLAAFNGENVKVQWEAAKSMGLIGSKRAIKPLIEALLTSLSTEKRTAAAYALGLLKDERAVKPLVDILNNKKEHPKLRGQSAEALANFNRREVVDSLLEALKDQEPEVRFWSAFALGELRVRKALPALKRLAEKDTAHVPSWWIVSSEAVDAIHRINGCVARTASRV